MICRSEVLLADTLVMVSKELAGKPLTNHELFSEGQNRCHWLKDYTLLATNFLHDLKGNIWQTVLSHQRTDMLILPPQTMQPDLFGLLKCIEGTPSYKQFGAHCIPIVASCKLYTNPTTSLYRANYASTNMWDGFTKFDPETKSRRPIKGSESDRATLCDLLEKTFGERRRSVRISFVFNPHSVGKLAVDSDSLHLKFDYHHAGFRNTLERNSEEALQLLKEYVKIK